MVDSCPRRANGGVSFDYTMACGRSVGSQALRIYAEPNPCSISTLTKGYLSDNRNDEEMYTIPTATPNTPVNDHCGPICIRHASTVGTCSMEIMSRLLAGLLSTKLDLPESVAGACSASLVQDENLRTKHDMTIAQP